MQDTGDITATQMRVVADLWINTALVKCAGTHHQNLVLTDVKLEDVYDVYQVSNNTTLLAQILAYWRILSHVQADYCSLANASTLNIVNQVNQYLQDADCPWYWWDSSKHVRLYECAHHHVADIGILGVDKMGEHWYQISLGGRSGQNAKRDILKSVPVDAVAATVDDIPQVYSNIVKRRILTLVVKHFAEVGWSYRHWAI